MLAAEELWRHLDNPETRSFYAPYLAVLPSPDEGDGGEGKGPTPLTTTDFFTEAELGLLSWGPVQVGRAVDLTREEGIASNKCGDPSIRWGG